MYKLYHNRSYFTPPSLSLSPEGCRRERGINRRREAERVSGVSSCLAGPRYCSLAAGPAIIINIICLYHSPGTFAFSRHYEDDMLINEYSRHSAIRPAPHPPSPAYSPRIPHPPSLPHIPKRDGMPICFPAASPTPLLFALKGTNSIHSYDKDALIQEERGRGGSRRGG